MKGDDDLMKRVSAFLPILQAANEKGKFSAVEMYYLTTVLTEGWMVTINIELDDIVVSPKV